MKLKGLIITILIITIIVFKSFTANDNTQRAQARENSSNTRLRINPDAERYPTIDERNINLLPPRRTLGIPERTHYIDRAGNYIFYGEPLLQGKLNIGYKIDDKDFIGIDYSERYFYTPRITDDDIFDNLITGIDGINYKGQLEHDFRFLNKGHLYPPFKEKQVYPPRTFIRLEINTPEGKKYIIIPSLDRGLLYQIKPNEIENMVKLIIQSFNRFRKNIRDLILHERIRYSAFYWITLKRSRYENINLNNIIWHFYNKSILNEQHITENLDIITEFFKKENLVFNKQTLIDNYKRADYINNPETAMYYVFRFRVNNFLHYIINPVNKTYHNALNNPIKEIITYYARLYLAASDKPKIIFALEQPQGTWSFLNGN